MMMATEAVLITMRMSGGRDDDGYDHSGGDNCVPPGHILNIGL